MKKSKAFRRISSVAAATALISSISATAFAYEGEYSVWFTYSDDGITAALSDTVVEDISSSYNIDGTSLTIYESGTYVVSGSSESGDISVSANTDDVTLVLSDLTLASDDEDAVITAGKNSDVTIVVDGENTLTETGSEGSVIKSKSGSTLTIVGDDTDEGENMLNIDAAAEDTNGIKGAENVDIIIGDDTEDDLTLNVTSTKNGIASDGTVTVNSGDINITAGGGAASASDDNSSKGIKADVSITINGGNITIDAADDGIHLNGTNGDETLSVNGGTITVAAGDDAIHSDYYLIIGKNDGTGKPTISITQSCEGIEGAIVILNAGTGEIISSDDGINAANSDLDNYSFSITINGGTWYINADGDGLDSNGDITVNGGTTTVFGSSQGDNAALDYGDNNNSFTVTGGTIVGVGINRMATVPTSGTYVQFGTSGMMGVFNGEGITLPEGGENGQSMTPPDMNGFNGQEMTPPESSGNGQSMTPPDMSGFNEQGMTPPESKENGQGMTPPDMSGFNGQGMTPPEGGANGQGMNPFDMSTDDSGISITAGQLIEIKDSEGNTIWSATAVKNANSVVYSSEELTENGSYTLYIDGEEIATSSTMTGNGRSQGMFPSDGTKSDDENLPENKDMNESPVTIEDKISTDNIDQEDRNESETNITEKEGTYTAEKTQTYALTEEYDTSAAEEISYTVGYNVSSTSYSNDVSVQNSYTAAAYSNTSASYSSAAGSGTVSNASHSSISRRKMKAIIRRYVMFNGSASYDEIHKLMIESGFFANGNVIVKVQGKKVASGWSEEAAKVIEELSKEGTIKVTFLGLFA